MRPAQLGRLVDELQARGVRVVAWYLPGHVKPALDVRRSLAMLRFRTAGGGAFDGIALNIESTRLRNADLRSRRAVALAQRVRQEAGETPSRSCRSTPRARAAPEHVAAIPWAELAATSTRSRRWSTRRRVQGLRCDVRLRHQGAPAAAGADGKPGRPDPRRRRRRRPHGAGGARGVRRCGLGRRPVLGVSLYDWATTRPPPRGARSRRSPARPRPLGGDRGSRGGAPGAPSHPRGRA